jgi:transcriptional regulator with XRE-family HTH domain
MLNERLKNLRLAKGMTLQQVGDAFGISAASVASWEKGKNQPDSRKLSKIAQVLGTTVEFLLNGSCDTQFTQVESLQKDVPFVSWDKLLSSAVSTKANTLTTAQSAGWVTPLHTSPSGASFATRFPGSMQLSWSQGPIPAGAVIFVDPSKGIQTDALVLVSVGKHQIDLARVQLPAKPSGHYLKLISSGDSVISVKDTKVLGTVVEWRISGIL